LRRIIIIGTALAVLGVAGVAFAAADQNTYAGSGLAISGGKSKNAPLSLVETLKAANKTSGNRAAALTRIVVKIAGVKLDVGKLPTCSDAKILANKTQKDGLGGCSKNSLIGSGAVNALLGAGDKPTDAGTACNPHLNVFNGGPRTQVFYFWTKSANDCGGLTTGATAPYDGKISYSGGNAVIDVPLPPDISTKVANQANLWGSLIRESLNFAKKVAGKTYMANSSCNGKRKWSIAFTAAQYGGGSATSTVSGSSKC
jgi:hypothetical protein